MKPTATLTPDPDDNEFRRAMDIFSRALEVDAARREAFIEEACGPDTALRARVLKLVDAHGRGDHFLERPSYLAPGHKIGEYRIERILGEGGMGVVYLAQDLRLPRQVAIKALSPAYTHDPSRRERFRREASAAAALSHPGIPTVFEFVEHKGELFIVGEYLNGETLREEIARGPVGPAGLIGTATGIASALAAAHDRGIVHRDLKPENIMRTADGQIKILDFGLAHLRDFSSDVTITKDGSVLGTPAYMAPEQIRRDPVDGRTDLFALGIVLHEMATGKHPFISNNPASTIARILEIEPPPIGGSSAGSSGVSGSGSMRVALDVIIRRCLRKQPAERFESAHELMVALERARDGRSGSNQFAPGPQGPQRWWKVHHVATCVAYAGLMVPMFLARRALEGTAGRLGLVLFLATLGAVVASVVLRLHLWFTASSIPGQWTRQYRHATPWLRLSDSIAVLGFLVAGGALIATNNKQEALAAVLICAGVVFDQDG
jgi:predicted Ser/Thr protein kinase